MNLKAVSWLVFLITLLFYIGWALIWGFATRAVIWNKGYYENWFWWGFFFWFIALLVALSKPECHDDDDDDYDEVIKRWRNNSIDSGGWRCVCGAINQSYTGTCGCGRTKDGSFPAKVPPVKALPAKEAKKTPSVDELNSVADSLKKFKELSDAGIISQEEFEIKKKQLLNL